jgi:hypothetical protein
MLAVRANINGTWPAMVAARKPAIERRGGDMLERRRPLIDPWAGYCAKPATGGEVAPTGAGAAGAQA